MDVAIVGAGMTGLSTRTKLVGAEHKVTMFDKALRPLGTWQIRWRYARLGSAGGRFRWDAARILGLCGDWLSQPRVDATGISGNCPAQAMCR